MSTRHRLLLVSVLLVALIASCAPKMVAPQPTAAAPSEGLAMREVEAPAPAPQQDAKAEESVSAAEQVAARGALTSLSLSGRKIIKRGNMRLVVVDTDRAMDEAVAIALDSGGYVISAESKLVEGYREADLTFGVPVEQFEAVQAKMRRLALRVTDDQSSGEDVTDQYVDLQSQLTNLEATAARVRQFLEQARTVEEALKVNQQLSELEGEIEQVKGRMNYLKERAAFSTLSVGLRPERPTPTPSPTATPTPTPTPPGWHPDQTFRSASRTLTTLMRVAGDLVIWVVVVLVPIIAPLVLLVWLIKRFAPKKEKPAAKPDTTAPPKPPAPAQKDEDKSA